MKNKISELLKSSLENEFIIKKEDGTYTTLAAGVVGEVVNIKDRILVEIFGNVPLNDEQKGLLKKLQSINFSNEVKIRKPRTKKNKTA